METEDAKTSDDILLHLEAPGAARECPVRGEEARRRREPTGTYMLDVYHGV